ncbi:MAG: hypothetical protein JJ992_10980 [Planctomycetes bacterium]|nr:hypothetical protein [Planctomycetota bacterium]
MQPWVGDADLLEASADDVMQATPRQMQPRDQLNQLGISGVTLPPGVIFYGGTSETDARGAEAANSQASGGAGLGGTQTIVFYPDGSSSEARVILTNERFFVQVKLRGLTGLTQGSDLLVAEELTP